MKKSLQMLFVGLLYSASLIAQPANPESIKLLMQKSGAGDMGEQVMNQMIPALKQMLPQAPEKFWADIMTEFDGGEMENLLIPVYQKHFDETDIEAINKFFDSAAGKKLAAAQPSIVQESMAIGQQWGQGLAQRVLKKYQDEVETANAEAAASE